MLFGQLFGSLVELGDDSLEELQFVSYWRNRELYRLSDIVNVARTALTMANSLRYKICAGRYRPVFPKPETDCAPSALIFYSTSHLEGHSRRRSQACHRALRCLPFLTGKADQERIIYSICNWPTLVNIYQEKRSSCRPS